MGIALLSSWRLGYSYVWPVCSNSGEGDWLGPCPCGSTDSLGKVSSQSRFCVHVAAGYQKGKVKAVPGKRLFYAPAGGKKVLTEHPAPKWAWTTQTWRLLPREDPFQPPLEPHWPLIQKSWHYYDTVNREKYYEGLSLAVHKWMLPWGVFTTGWDKRCQVELLWEKEQRGIDKEK